VGLSGRYKDVAAIAGEGRAGGCDREGVALSYFGGIVWLDFC